MRMIRCSYCDDDIVYINREVHFESCPKVIINCQFCTRKLEREKMTQHIDPEKGDCEDKLVHCDYFGVGCKEKAPRKMMGEHARRHLGEHLLMLLQTLIPFLTMVQNIEHQFEAIGTLESTVADHQKKIGRLENSRQAASENLSKLASCTVGNRTDGINPSSDEYTKTIRRIEDVVERLKNSLLVLQTKVSTTEGVTAVIGNQVEAVIDKVKSLTRNDENAKEVIESLERKVKSQDRIIAVKDVALAEQDIRIQALEMASFDGILLWKISNFSRKRNDAISGRTTSIYSPCFYTGRRGYKMCARIYLNGDGMGKGNHVSLFFVIMKGEFDALSRWPFRQKVTLMWLDQSNREDVIDAFRPDPTSDSFQRPNNDMNIASGCPLFMPLSQLDNPRHAYMKDDVAFIKICVDVSDLNCC
ncbi:TNF receptor-associated factor 2-like [Glandiceps talaboti]